MTALGVDVGSTTAKVVVIGGDGRLEHAACARHHARPRACAEAMIARALAAIGEAPRARGVTGSIGTALAEPLGAVPVHEVRAVARAVEARGIACSSVVELGGQDAKILRLDEPVDMQMNDRCAAGTGATIDRIVRRLGLLDLGAIRLEGDLVVAAKCGVFAETDVVNLVKRGARAEAALSALARAIVVQNLAVLARGRALQPPVLLLGGPHRHLPILREAWAEALATLWARRGITPGPVEVPSHAELFAAWGAALHAACGARPTPSLASVLATRRVDEVEPPREVELAPLRVATAATPCVASAGALFLGPAAGSTTSKAVLVAADGALVTSSYAPSAGEPTRDAQARLADVLEGIDPARVRALGVTGYGAELVGPAFGADAAPVETVAHAAAARRAMPDVDVVVDVGGTDVKVLCLDRSGRVRDFYVSNQCAAGHGAFLAASAADLGVPLERFAQLALAEQLVPRFTVGCAVFMDTDRVSFAREGHGPGALLAGLARALPRAVWDHVVPRRPEALGRRFLLTGGAHANLAVALAHARYLRERVPEADVRVPPHPRLSGAIGAAILASAAVGARPSAFVGLPRARAVRVSVARDESTRCRRCELACERSLVSLSGARAETLVLGNGCERGADADAGAERTRRHAPDLLAEEAERLFRPLLPAPRARPARRVVFGIPRVMALYRSAPLLLHYLRAAGVRAEDVILTPPTSSRAFHEGARWGVNDPCFPAKLVDAHVEALLSAKNTGEPIKPACAARRIRRPARSSRPAA